MDAKCFEISIYRLKQLQQIFVSQQQIKRGTVSHAMLNTTGRVCHCDFNEVNINKDRYD